jgi:hypothetical protein
VRTRCPLTPLNGSAPKALVSQLGLSFFRLCPRFSRDRVEAPKAQCAFHRDTLANEVGAGAGSAVVDVRVVMQNDIQQ